MDVQDAFSIDSARAYVARIDLPHANLGLDQTTPQLVFDAAKQQSVLVGSGVISFDTGVEETFRQAASDCALLAQLYADKNSHSDSDPIAWFDSYFGVLGNLGWVTQSRDTATYKVDTEGMEVHEAIIQIVTAFLGNVPGAVQLIELALKSLQSMNKQSPLITIFARESEKAHIGRVQFTTIRPDAQQGLLAEAMAFGLSAKKEITQVLFFKLHNDEATLRRSLGTLSLNRPAIEALAPAIRNKVLPFMATYVAELDIGSPTPPQPAAAAPAEPAPAPAGQP